MTTIIFPTVENIRVYVESEYQGEAQPWEDCCWHSHHLVTISVPELELEYQTDYYSSRGLTCLDGQECANVLQCLLQDASSYDYSEGDIDEFCNELGYQPGSRCSIKKILSIFDGCKRAHEAMEALGLYQHGGEISEAIDNEDYEIEED